MPQSLISVSISHHRAPVEVRERLHLKEPEARALLERMKPEIAREALIVSTCNRTELYALPVSEQVSSEYLIDFLLGAKGIPHAEVGAYRDYFERMSYCDSILHLFRVASGTDSQIIGDQQILSQVKDAFRIATESGASGSILTKLAHAAFRAAKRVISETSLMTGAATISFAAVELSRKIYDDLRSRRVLIIGAGESAELVAKHFAERGVRSLTVANRTLERATTLLANATEGEGRAIELAQLPEALSSSDIVVSATSASGFVLTKEMVQAALKKRESSSPLVLVDIAVPRDIDPETRRLPNVFLKDIDDLRAMVDQNLERRKLEIPKAETIVREELDHFLQTLSKLEVGPTIKELREKFEAVRREELDRHRAKLDEKSFAMMDEMTRRMMNRLLHQPMVTLKEPAGAGRTYGARQPSNDDMMTRIEIVRKLFALDGNGEE
ncbi:MAG: glutamyl-tRNA reductase [Bacteroidota bacterium]|nr:glutamyl-tRNA reductase [Bacteroidota bacterium]MDP4232541.1 glutamyl-tRNA reductase [Bacteroidota bacterium]MDP4241676.1 glutamyl-tRNA reductase [Bacteroidota bacterium]MDP4286421.1 glutamyl-tRNA reductase [Bacteroidota bacterium]